MPVLVLCEAQAGRAETADRDGLALQGSLQARAAVALKPVEQPSACDRLRPATAPAASVAVTRGRSPVRASSITWRAPRVQSHTCLAPATNPFSGSAASNRTHRAGPLVPGTAGLSKGRAGRYTDPRPTSWWGAGSEAGPSSWPNLDIRATQELT